MIESFSHASESQILLDEGERAMVGIFPFKSEFELKTIPRATLQFIIACALVHIVTWRIFAVGADPELWFDLTDYSFWFPPSALSHIFVHTNFEHLFYNMFFFFLFAAPLEQAEGRKKFWILVIFSAFFSSYFETLVLWLFDLWTSSDIPYIAERNHQQIIFRALAPVEW